MKKYLLLFFLFISFGAKSQNIYDKSQPYRVDCYTAPDSLYKTVIIGNSNYKYLVFDIERTLDSVTRGTVLLRSLSYIDKSARIEIAGQLIKQFQLTSVLFFENCSLVKVFYQAIIQTPEQKKAIEKGTDFFYARDIIR
ncbi:hypothetical protein [Ferruginibacter sp.]|nr:hypothetical protein [Ferruginibacter sp.]